MLFFVLSLLAAWLAPVLVHPGRIKPIAFAQTPLHWHAAKKGENCRVGIRKISMPMQKAPPKEDLPHRQVTRGGCMEPVLTRL